MKTKKSGLTLAEVLITLAVLGMVIAICIPVLNQGINKKEFATAMKRNLNDLNVAADLIRNDNYGYFAGALGSSHNAFMQAFCNKMNCIKQCPVGSADCFFSNWKALDGGGRWVTPAARSSMILSNGATAYFARRTESCTDPDYKIDGVNSLCGFITLDVNGFKGPNIAGRDIFIFAITSKGIVPNELSNAGASYMNRCDPTQSLTNNGDFCAARILKEGDMNY